MSIIKRYSSQFIVIVALLLATVSCNRQRALSDDELALVFRDAFLSNAYTTTNKLNLDSLRLYEPIFSKYGYTSEDVQYTIGSFANRKSARLSDVVERAISMLETVGTELDYQVSILDTIDNIATRRTIRTIYEDSIITMRSMRDTSNFAITFENLEVGEYDILFDYLIDSLDTTTGNYLTQNWIEDRSSDAKPAKQIRKKNGILNRNNIAKYENSFMIQDSTDVAVIKLAIPSKPKGKGTPHLTIKRLNVNKTLSNSEARDSLFSELFTVRIFDDEILFKR